MALARTLIAACLLLAIPLVALATLWLPAELIVLRDDARRTTMPGTPSFHQSIQTEYRSTLAIVILTAAALLCIAASSIIIARPRSIAAIVVWIAIVSTTAAYLATFTAQHPPRGVPTSTIVVFWGVPGAIALLAIAGAITSARLAIRR